MEFGLSIFERIKKMILKYLEMCWKGFFIH